MQSFILADIDIETRDVILSYFKDNCNILIPSSFNDLLTKPFLNSSFAIIEYNFSNNRGLEALKSLKTARPSLPVFFTTSQSTEDLCLNAFRLGARDYFRKPLTKDIVKSIELILRYKKREGRTNVLLDIYADNILLDSTPRNVSPNIEQTKTFIEENYNQPLSLQLLAKIACMSKYHFCRIFKKQVNMTYTTYLNTIRIKEAKRLLKTGLLSITEICFQIGYNDLTYFERVFKKSENCSPSSYRKKFNQIFPSIKDIKD